MTGKGLDREDAVGAGGRGCIQPGVRDDEIGIDQVGMCGAGDNEGQTEGKSACGNDHKDDHKTIILLSSQSDAPFLTSF